MNEQIDLFSYSMPRFHIGNRKIRLIELFAGIGSQAKALENLGVNFETYRVVEWDKFAMASYNAIHHTDFETSDIQKIHASDLGIVETDKYCYIMTYSFPCQDLSQGGKMQGMAKGDNTRSGLLWEVERILEECDELPQVLLMENVPNVIGKFVKDFQKWRSKLEKLGYSNYVQILNAKDYGIPQNRNRCFMVSILGDYYYQFPKKQKLKLKLKDMLEENVDEKYYLSQKAMEGYLARNLKDADCDTTVSERERERVAERSEQVAEDRLTDIHGMSSSKEYYEIKCSHGWNKGSVKRKDIISTIDTGVTKWHLLIGEKG